jgi:hypothetical protein
MYKKSDFSHEATRAIELHKCPKTGEFGLIVWLGTKSPRALRDKSVILSQAIAGKNLKTFPKV